MRSAVTTPSRNSLNAQRLRVILAGICALILTVGIARFAYTPLLPVMRDEAGLSQFAGGWLATFNYLGYLCGALLAATIKELRHKYVLYRLNLAIALITTAVMGLTDNTTLWALLRFVSGFSSTGGLLLASGLVLNWLIRHDCKPILGVHFTGMGLGIVVTGIAASVMIGHLNWAQQWITFGLLGVLFFIPAWRWLPAPPKTAAGGAYRTGQPPSKRWMNLLIASYFCAGVGYVVSATFIVAILQKSPLLSDHGGLVWVILGVAAIPSSFLWDRVAGALGQIPALQIGYALQILSFLLPVLSDNTLLALLSAILYGGTFVGIVSLTLALIGRHFPDNPAKAMARLTLSYGVGQIIAPAIAGYIASRTGSYVGALILATVVMLVGMVLLQRLGRLEQET